jgi:hypothetical protein
MFRTSITKLRPLRRSGRYTAAAGAITLGLSSFLLTAVHLDNGERRRDLDDTQNRIANTVVPERVSPGSAVDTSTFLVGSSSGVRRYDTARIARLVLLQRFQKSMSIARFFVFARDGSPEARSPVPTPTPTHPGSLLFPRARARAHATLLQPLKLYITIIHLLKMSQSSVEVVEGDHSGTRGFSSSPEPLEKALASTRTASA